MPRSMEHNRQEPPVLMQAELKVVHVASDQKQLVTDNAIQDRRRRMSVIIPILEDRRKAMVVEKALAGKQSLSEVEWEVR